MKQDDIERMIREMEMNRADIIRARGMANFAKDLKDDPKRSLEFFRNAGILDEAGNLTKFYQGGNKE